MSNLPPEKTISKPQTEEHKMNALASEFQTTLNISPQMYPQMSYPNYYQNYNEYNYGYPPTFNYPPVMPYKYANMQQQPMMENYYPSNEKSFVKIYLFYLFSLFLFVFCLNYGILSIKFR